MAVPVECAGDGSVMIAGESQSAGLSQRNPLRFGRALRLLHFANRPNG